VEASRLLPVDASVAFAWVADLRTHPRFVPLTRLDAGCRGGPRIGDVVTMVSGPGARRGARGIVDRMVVELLERPSTTAGRVGRTRLRKLGPVLLGEAGFDVVPVDHARCRVVWWEEAHLARLRIADPVVRVALRVMMRVALTRLDRALTRTANTPDGRPRDR
jgi:hypothetical protein